MADMSSKLGKIFIGGLSYETTDEKLRSYFSAFGPVTDAVVMKDPISRRSRGFGFITYVDPDCVDRALAQPNHILDSRRVEAKRAVPRAESISRDSMSSTASSRNDSVISSASNASNMGTSRKIFVGGLHYETKDAEFRRYFQVYGKVVSAEVMFNRETNKSRGFGFVIFEQESSVDEVLKEVDHVIDGKTVEVKRAVPRTDIPPPRSVSSRANSFTGMMGTGGPGSVGSVDDVISIGSTASISRSCTPSSSLSASGTSLNELSTRTTANASGLSGYAAAVRYGGRGVRSKVGSASLGMLYHEDEEEEVLMMMDPAEKTLASVADALTSLVLDDDETTVSSTQSGTGSSPVVQVRSPLGITPRPLSESLRDGWHLSPATVTPQPQPSTAPSQSAWQARPWQKGWESQAAREDEARTSEDPLATTPSYFSAFAGSDRRGSNSQSTWSTPTYPTSIPPVGPSNNTSSLSGGHGSYPSPNSNVSGSHGSSTNSSGKVGSGTFGGFRSRPAPYSTLGAFFPPEYLSSAQPSVATANVSLPQESTLESGVLSDLYNPQEVLSSDRHTSPFQCPYR